MSILLIVAASLLVEHRLWGDWASVVGVCRLSCPAACGIFPDTGIEPVSAALTDRFSSTLLPEKSDIMLFVVEKIPTF